MTTIVGRGEIGRGLYAYLRRYGEVRLVGHRELVEGYCYICSGVTKTKDCEERPLEAWRINVENTVEIASKTEGIWISSERVFDGSVPFRGKWDERSPTTEYGRQKVITENFLLGDGRYGVIRFSKVIGWAVPLFEGWVDDLRKDREIHPFSNMSMAPISLGYACEVLRKMRGRVGLYQVSGDRDISYDRIAYHICNYMGKDLKLVQPVLSDKPHPYTTLKSDFETEDSWEVIYDWCRKRIQPN